MTIIYDPNKMLKKLAPPKKIERMLNKNLTVNQAAFAYLDDADFINKRDVKSVALKVSKNYRERVKEESGREAKAELKRDLKDDPAYLIQQVENEIVYQVSQDIREEYRGEEYKWLPSDADEPDPEHQLLYGKVFRIGDGEQPGDRIGCRCGMEILVTETKLEL